MKRKKTLKRLHQDIKNLEKTLKRQSQRNVLESFFYGIFNKYHKNRINRLKKTINKL